MTDNEIIKALECCMTDTCSECPFTFAGCIDTLPKEAIKLIKRQQAEIERLEYEKQIVFNEGKAWHTLYQEAIKGSEKLH